MSDKLVCCEDVSVTLGGRVIMRELNLSINRDDFVVVVGSNGSGKSTLIKILLGITSITKGSIEYSNKNLKISYLGHKNAIKNYLTPSQNLQLLFDGATLSNAFEWLEKLDLFQMQDELTANLSFGQQKKLALIRVLAQSPELIVLDEPFVGLDHAASDLLNNFFIQKFIFFWKSITNSIKKQLFFFKSFGPSPLI